MILINNDQSDDSSVITIESSGNSDTPQVINVPISDNNDDATTGIDRDQTSMVRTRSRSLAENEVNTRVHTRSMVTKNPVQNSNFVCTPTTMKGVRNTPSNIKDSVQRNLQRLEIFYNPT